MSTEYSMQHMTQRGIYRPSAAFKPMLKSKRRADRAPMRVRAADSQTEQEKKDAEELKQVLEEHRENTQRRMSRLTVSTTSHSRLWEPANCYNRVLKADKNCSTNASHHFLKGPHITYDSTQILVSKVVLSFL